MSEVDIIYPTAEELDTEGTNNRHLELYLVPALEGEGKIKIAIHGGVGNLGWPIRAFHHRWAHIGDVKPNIVGDSVFELLQTFEDELRAVSATYRGAHFDGNNHVGEWEDAHDSLRSDWDRAVQDGALKSYWSAGDWFGGAAIDWEGLCDEAKVDPELALNDGWEAVVADVAGKIKAAEEEHVSGIAEYAMAEAEKYRAFHLEDEEDDDE